MSTSVTAAVLRLDKRMFDVGLQRWHLLAVCLIAPVPSEATHQSLLCCSAVISSSEAPARPPGVRHRAPGTPACSHRCRAWLHVLPQPWHASSAPSPAQHHQLSQFQCAQRPRRHLMIILAVRIHARKKKKILTLSLGQGHAPPRIILANRGSPAGPMPCHCFCDAFPWTPCPES